MALEQYKPTFAEWWGDEAAEAAPAPAAPASGFLATAKPPGWYGQQYFAAQSPEEWTSNYKHLGGGGYCWETLGTHFQRTAAMLLHLFPAAQTWLDVGCARGYLVRALREAGVQAVGIDHSPWCMTHVDPTVREVCIEWALEELPTGFGHFDILTAFETLEHCDTAQIQQGLKRLRRVCNSGMFATIPTPDQRHQGAWGEAVNESSHVTLKPRAWWMEQFLQAGWQHSPFHRMAEEYIESIWLVRNSGWNVFCLSPGAA